MKQIVKLSTFSLILSVSCVILLLVVLYFSSDDIINYIICAILVVWMALALYYMPMSISCDSNELCIRRSLRVKRIPLSDIESVTVCPPTMAERRICCSGGWFGYWGWFSEPSIGKYFAYYGKSSECFLVSLKSGRQYLLGCENMQDMVDYIQKQL